MPTAKVTNVGQKVTNTDSQGHDKTADNQGYKYISANMNHHIKQLLLSLALLAGIATAAADNLYVITDGSGNYLANDGGTLSNAPEFNPVTCLWTCPGTTGTLSNQGGYLRCSSRSNPKLSLTTSSTSASSWTVTSNKKVYSSVGIYATYYIYNNSGTWNASTSSSSGAYCYAVTSVQTAAQGSMNLDYNTGVDYTFERFGDIRDYTATDLQYVPAYNTYTWTTATNTETTYYASSDGSYVADSAPEAVTTAASYAWSSDQSSNVTVTQSAYYPEQATAEYAARFTDVTTVTVTATATIQQSASKFMTADATVTATDKATLQPRDIAAVDISVDDRTVYVGETTKIHVTTESDGAVTYTVPDQSLVTVSADGTVTAVSTNGADEAYVNITVSTAQTTTYDAASAVISLKVMKRPAALSFTYDKTTLTYGDEAPKITSTTLIDGITYDALTSAIYYNSSDLCVSVDGSTGALTVNKAGTTTITARYLGNDTYASTTHSVTITVEKATPTLTFPEENYNAQISHDFTSPVATLSPEGAGTVTYSCTSTPDGIVSVDTTTGEVTLGTVAGVATITATCAGNDCYNPATASYMLAVTVKALPEVTVNTNVEYYVDDTYKVTATTQSTKGVTFESVDADVLTVDEDGNLTAKSEGQTIITITSLEDDTYEKYTVHYPVTVKRYPTDIRLSYPGSKYYTDQTETVACSFTVHETVNNTLPPTEGLVSFVSSDTSVATVDASTGRLAIVGAGGAVITAIYEGTYKYAPSSVRFLIFVEEGVLPGTFIRMKDNDGLYLRCDGTAVTTSASADAATIMWYGEDRSLLFYQCGHYLQDASMNLMPAVNVGESGTRFTFSHSDQDYEVSDGTSKMTSAGSTVWIVEQVESLPLTFKSAGNGYSTLYCPVDVTCPAGVVAYYATGREADATGAADYVVSLKSVDGGYIPHSTPVVLYTQNIGTYDFYLVEEFPHALTDLWDGLTGTLPMLTTSSVYSGTQCPYTLQPDKSGSVGFYPWDSNRHATIEPFRCYIPGSNAASSKGFRFSFDDEEPTGIADTPADTPSDAMIYNLQGVPLGTSLQSLPSGIYLRTGRKVVKE